MGNELFKNIPSKVGDLVKDVRNGRIGLPDLQRPFVWKDNKVRELFDSMLKGYPIGYIMLWESPADYESKKSTIGDNSKTYEEPKELVIDGQQRLTALVAAMFAVKVKDKNFADREIKISYNPLTREFAVWSQAYEKDTEWISRISDVFLAKEDNSISSLRRHFIREANEGRSKKEFPLLTDEEEDRIEDSINALLNLSDYSLPTLEISYMLVVCKDTDHAIWVEQFVKSDEFRSGAYRNKTIIVHSKQKGAETEANTRLLLDVENPKNPVEIVIHVNMLKEGWDVNNLYTIVPLRTAASKILREQMVGRGLRLPYGERTGDRDVDAVMLTAHDKFNDILAEAQKGDSIFKAGNVIKAEEIKPEEVVYTQLTIETDPDAELEKAYAHTQIEKTDATDALLKKAADLIKAEVERHIQHTPAHTVTHVQAQQIVETVKQKVAEDKDLGQTFKENEMPLAAWMLYQTEETHRAAVNKFIPIPRIKVTDAGVEEYVFVDFDLDMADFTHVPIKNELLVQNLEDMQDRQRIKGDAIDFEGYNPKKVILEQLRQKPEIDYEKCSKLLFKLITQVCDHYETQYGTNGMQNIIMMYKRDIGNKIYKQMLQHFYCENGFLQEEVVGTRDYNLQQSYSCAERVNLFSDDYTGNIQSVLFEGVKRGVFSAAKFDSRPELVLARVLETDTDVQNWLRPAPQEFNITYNHGHNYEPDFVVETDDTIYLVEVKGEDKLSDPDVIAKKKRGIQYCEVASRWGKANGYKQWRYLFIPSKQVMPNSSFMQLAKRFGEY